MKRYQIQCVIDSSTLKIEREYHMKILKRYELEYFISYINNLPAHKRTNARYKINVLDL